jgi:predicted Rossmann-fold nucleotide-binding protein
MQDDINQKDNDKMDASITPNGSMDLLSRSEVARLKDTSEGGLYQLFRRCSLAVLNSGISQDNLQEFEGYDDFRIKVIQRNRGLKLIVENAPASAFVDGVMIKGLQELLFAVLRDIIFVNNRLKELNLDLNNTEGITNAVFEILRNAGLLITGVEPNLVVCWGGHAINRKEYDYSKEVGYRLGLRGLEIITGCGSGAMKGPMKGATIAHAKQRIKNRRYIGISEPGIIASEPPNAIVDQLIVMPDIEKRLEAFVRLGHGIVVFPGGAGTIEEVLYILGILLHPDNKNTRFPLIFAGNADAKEYFEEINRFLVTTLGEEITSYYEIIINDPVSTASRMAGLIEDVRKSRLRHRDAFYFNWRLTIPEIYQLPFHPTHENMNNLDLFFGQENHALAANLRKVFSGIVAGNVKYETAKRIKRDGPFILKGDSELMKSVDRLLKKLVSQKRMRIDADDYNPCYKIEKQ